MGRRIAYLGLATALCLALVAGLSVTPGCYDVPQPVCGFFCGSGGACPDDYTCNTSDNRCHLNGSAPTTCLPLLDGGPIDMPDSIGIDVMVDAPNAAPTVSARSPVPNATGVGVGIPVTAMFSEDVQGVSSSSFTLFQGATPVAATVLYSTITREATLTPSAMLLPNTTYTANLTSAITDLSGAQLAAINWSFTTGTDTLAPSVTARTPMPNATSVSLTSTVTAQFNEPVMGVSGTTFTLANGATPIAGTVTYTAATRTATFTPTSPLPGNTVLTATLTSGITDTSANALTGAPVTWTFTTIPDTVAPTVTTRTPAPAATMVSPGTTIVAMFDEPVQNVTLTTFIVNDGAAVTGTLASSNGGRTWTFTPSAMLATGATVTVTLSTGITDLASNPLAAPVTWMFNTAADMTAPTVMSTTPAASATNVAVTSTIAVTFSEPVTGVTGTSFTVTEGSAVAGSLGSSNGGRTWTFTPSASFANNATVMVTLSTAVMDLVGNPLATPFTFNFTTVPDTTAPTVMSTVPAANATGVALASTIAVTFDEPVTNVTTTTFTVNSGGAVGGSLASSNGGRTWTFTPSAAFSNNATVTVTLSSGITDAASNPLAAPFTFMFTTVPDTTAPTVQSTTPAANAMNVATSTTIVAMFSEPVMNVTASTFTVNDGTVVTGTLASSNGGRTWTFMPSAALAATASVSITLTAGITDLAGNPLGPPVVVTFMTQ
ncbi:MAG: Ig-like domain-containing protein [Deltaproteobacteria bacterium]|nr:Ig-like domain-containing protein [Deltaproteobacteria bacterium]